MTEQPPNEPRTAAGRDTLDDPYFAGAHGSPFRERLQERILAIEAEAAQPVPLIQEALAQVLHDRDGHSCDPNVDRMPFLMCRLRDYFRNDADAILAALPSAVPELSLTRRALTLALSDTVMERMDLDTAQDEADIILEALAALPSAVPEPTE